MQRTSTSIGALAGALAKAQCDLTNPQKSSLATLSSPAGEPRTYRYAPLSSGLNIIRKALGQQDIATVQTTSIEPSTGMVNLTTMLAHSSGEWIASEWPVCPATDIHDPQRMGMAMTYARRHALFALAGVAGEDDLDAPGPLLPAVQGGREDSRPAVPGASDGGRTAEYSKPVDIPNPARRLPLSSEASAILCDRLVAEISSLQDGEDAAVWVRRNISERNTLTLADADRVAEAFHVRIRSIPPEPIGRANEPTSNKISISRRQKTRAPDQADTIDKSLLAYPEPRRHRDRAHVRFVAQQCCLICGRQPADAHHLRFAQSRALGRKASDEFTVPLCRAHHHEVHRHGNETTWWAAKGVEPLPAARELWLETHPLPAAAG